MNWESICSLCSDADLIVDDGLAETLIWHGGLSNLVSFGALSCQSLSENVKSNGPNGVILLSSPLMGDMVVTIQKIMESCTWKNVTIITASSGLLHLMLHKVEDQFSEEEVFDQFKSKVLEWNPNGASVRVCSATQMEVIDFKWSGEDRFTLINKPTPFLKPLLLQSLKQDGSSPYFSLESADQIQISDFAETVRQRLHNQNIQGDIWSCGDLASMIGSRLQKYQSKFDNKVAVVIFDRQIQFHADRNKESGNGLDDLIFHSEIEGRTNLKSKLLGFKTNITLPSSDRENSLYSALFDNTLEYAYTLAQNLFEQIFEEEGIDFKADGMLSTCLESIQKHTEAIMYNAGFISLCQLIEDAHSKNTISTSTSSLENLKANLDEYTPSQNIYNVINLLRNALDTLNFYFHSKFFVVICSEIAQKVLQKLIQTLFKYSPRHFVSTFTNQSISWMDLMKVGFDGH